MTMVKVKGFKIFRDKKPPFKSRCYHRATGHKIDLESVLLGSAAFFAECAKITALVEAQKARAPKAGTLGGLIEAYYRTEHFSDTLSDRTRKDYRTVARYLERILDTPISAIDTPLVSAIHDKATIKLGWRQANMLRTFLFEVFKYGIPKGLVTANFAAAVIPKPRPKGLKRANRPWIIEELTFVLDNAPAHLAAAVSVMAYTGLDPSDALHLKRDAMSNGTIWAARGKTGNDIAVPVIGLLAAALERAPKHDAITILASTKLRPWTYDGFSTAWHRWRGKQAVAGLLAKDLTLKGLRHTVATLLREDGMSKAEIADLLGQKTESMAHHYSRDANLAERNRKTGAALQNVIETRTGIVKPFVQIVKPDAKEA
jgi:integrase